MTFTTKNIIKEVLARERADEDAGMFSIVTVVEDQVRRSAFR
jgi:hypothetical protein